MFPRIDQRSVPFLTTEQMVEVDRAMIEDFRITLIQMMENAGRNLAQLARLRFLEADPDVCSFLMWVTIVTPARQRLALGRVVVNPLIRSHFVTVNAAVMARLSTSVLIRRGV